MEAKVKAYEVTGKEPYIFVSYSHKNEKKVLSIIGGLQKRGYRVWFDEGIYGGKNWRRVLGEKVEGCTVFILFLSRHYVKSSVCEDELNLAKESGKTIIPIYLEEVELTPGIKMALAGIQALMPNRKQEEQDLWDFIEMAEELACCRDSSVALPQSEKDSNDPSPKSSKEAKWNGLLRQILIGVVMLILVLILIESSLPGNPPAQSQTATGQPTETQPPAQTAAATTEPVATQTSAPRTLSGNVLMEVPKPETDSIANDYVFGTSITRDQVGSIWFHDSTYAPEDAVDASQARDGSVKVWTEKEGDYYQLHIAGDGGVDAPVNSDHLFREMVNLTQVYFFDSFYTANTESMTGMFYGCEKLYSLDVTGFNTEKVQSFHMMFGNCRMLDELDLSSFDTSSAVYMGYMFYNCSRLWKLDLSNFHTENVTNMKYMFSGCEELLSLDISSFDTGKVKKMSSMFYWCGALTQLDVSHFNTSEVIDMSNMFHGCRSLLALDVSNFNTAKVTDMSYMFRECSKVSELDVSGFDTVHVTNMSYMFAYCDKLESLDLSSFRTYNVTDMSYMFFNDVKLSELDFSGFHTGKVTSYENFMLEGQKVHNLPWQGLFAGNP